MQNDKPIGRRFSDVYFEKGEHTEDSIKLRKRIAHKLNEVVEDYNVILSLRSETGYYINSSPDYKFWIKFIEEMPLANFLDFLTEVVRAMSINSYTDMALGWIKFCKRAFEEENISFEMDHLGGMHFRVDEAYQSNRSAALATLNGSDKLAARQAFEEAQLAISSTSGDTLTAVRRSFDAVENLFKMRFETSRLGAAEIKAKMGKSGDRDGTRAADAARRFNAGFAEWTNACHQYRHAPGEADPSPPPRWLAVALVDSSATYLRYLASNQHS